MREITYMPRCCFANINNEEKEREKKGGERSQSIPSLERKLQGGDIILYPWFRAGMGDIFPVPRQQPRDREKLSFILYSWFRLWEGARALSSFFFFPLYLFQREEKVRYSNKNNIKEVTGKCKRR